MAYRCDSCNLLCSIEADEPDVSGETIDQEGSVSMEVSVAYNSGCCGGQVAQADYSLEGEVEVNHETEDCDGELDINIISSEATDRFQEKDRHGKPIKSFRYKRHYYGVEVEVEAVCQACSASATTTLSDEGGPPEAY